MHVLTFSSKTYSNTYALLVNEKPTNALISHCIGVRYSPTCFGTLKCHNQGVKHDAAEVDVQGRGKQRRMGAVYRNRRGGVMMAPVRVHSSHPSLLPTKSAPISAGSCLTPRLCHFKGPKHVGGY
jgi:hypothetical protein